MIKNVGLPSLAEGWVVDISYFGRRGTPDQRYYVGIANPDSAVDAVRQALKTSRGDTIQVSRRLSKRTVKLLALRPGELRAS